MLFFESKINLTGLELPLRATLIPTKSGNVLISPIDFTPEQLDKIKSMGGVQHIVAPTLLHHLYIKTTQQIFPEAKTWGIEGFALRRPDIQWDFFISEKNLPSPSLTAICLRGVPELNEIILFHPDSKTLIVADLFFNLQDPRGFLAPILCRLLGTHRKFNISRLLNRYIKDRQALKQSLKGLLEWDFQRVVMSHGDILESNAKSLVQQVLKAKGLV